MVVRKEVGGVSRSELSDESELSDGSSSSLAGIRVGLVEHRRVGGGPPFLPCFTLGIAEIGKHSSAVVCAYRVNMNIQDRSRHKSCDVSQ